MERVWFRDHAVTVREIFDDLSGSRDIAYTTVMSTMDNLRRKGWLARERVGKAYSYWPTMSREERSAKLMRDVFHSGDDADLVRISLSAKWIHMSQRSCGRPCASWRASGRRRERRCLRAAARSAGVAMSPALVQLTATASVRDCRWRCGCVILGWRWRPGRWPVSACLSMCSATSPWPRPFGIARTRCWHSTTWVGMCKGVDVDRPCGAGGFGDRGLGGEHCARAAAGPESRARAGGARPESAGQRGRGLS